MIISKKATRESVLSFVRIKYNTKPERLWRKFPNYCVFRHPNTKWYGIIMDIEKCKLRIDRSKERIDILVLRLDHKSQEKYLSKKGFMYGYHMDKDQWMGILLDGSVSQPTVEKLLINSYEHTI